MLGAYVLLLIVPSIPFHHPALSHTGTVLSRQRSVSICMLVGCAVSPLPPPRRHRGSVTSPTSSDTQRVKWVSKSAATLYRDRERTDAAYTLKWTSRGRSRCVLACVGVVGVGAGACRCASLFGAGCDPCCMHAAVLAVAQSCMVSHVCAARGAMRVRV